MLSSCGQLGLMQGNLIYFCCQVDGTVINDRSHSTFVAKDGT